MKLFFLILLSFWSFINLYGQNDNIGLVVEYNKTQSIEYIIYNPPLRINQIENQNSINYSEPAGLIKSFYSASNLEWALSDYLEDNAKTSRDEEHFEAVKKTDTQKNYIQLETIYKFRHESRQFAYIKYSFIMEEIPFPIIGTMSAEYLNNRWYINPLLNQNSILYIFANVEPKVLQDLFNVKSNDISLNGLIEEIKNDDNIFDFNLITQKYDSLMNNSDLRLILKDKRLTDKDYQFRNAIINSSALINNYKVSQPFILNDAKFSKYSKKDQNLIYDDENKEKFSNTPELVLLRNTPISLVHKFSFTEDNKKFYIIKYKDPNNKTAMVQEENGTFSIMQKDDYKTWKDLFLNIKSDVFIKLFQRKIEYKVLSKIAEKSRSGSQAINLNLLAMYFADNLLKLKSYTD